ncbi:hypothetical protein [Streptomyces sp. NPDC058371]|uniref:hypothetical protein n=1 Tax=Streptomyces sp. NPDC058371 TaxID=3346463 RepID=UPI003656F056
MVAQTAASATAMNTRRRVLSERPAGRVGSDHRFSRPDGNHRVGLLGSNRRFSGPGSERASPGRSCGSERFCRCLVGACSVPRADGDRSSGDVSGADGRPCGRVRGLRPSG